MIRIALALSLFSACAVDDGPIEIASDGPLGWSDEVAGAVAEWNDALTARGCDAPFELAETGLVFRWVKHESEDDFALVYTREEYRVLDRTKLVGEYRPILLHALGHKIGLENLEPGADSVMGENLCQLPDHLTEYDVDRAAFVLGCP